MLVPRVHWLSGLDDTGSMPGLPSASELSNTQWDWVTDPDLSLNETLLIGSCYRFNKDVLIKASF